MNINDYYGARLEPTGRVLRLVIDAVNECNLRCRYCHPGEVWRTQQLDAAVVQQAMTAADDAGTLEVVLTGGEMTMHHQLPAVLDSTHLLRRCASTLITNATLLTPEIQRQLAESNLTRICTSVDGITNDLHGSARGKNLPRVLDGLHRLAGTGKPTTVITVVHRGNWERAIELSGYLADRRLAVQHHLCAPSYSGQARENYPELALRKHEFHSVQTLVDEHQADLADRGVYLTFNSFWPATGLAPIRTGRTITLQQLSEQIKDTLCNIRPNGEFRLQATTWGREMVGNAALGSVHDQPPSRLLRNAESVLADGSAKQLPRDVEARHKFQIGTHFETEERQATDVLIGHADGNESDVELVPIRSVDKHWALDNPLDISQLAAELKTEPQDRRVLLHPTGVMLIFHRRHSLVTVLRPAEWNAVCRELATQERQPA
ncbi:radical SAM protein [Nocardia sp. NBC_01329]|uniref:radical SAM protein n=1 Tax=Nocardia sp. NBC_01329 TaxID=2903594 RepID=UPI002E150BA4|nr:radical SAM protein [Nocardia sp. NBC_01329]